MPLSLLEFPARVLMQCQGRVGPNVDQVAKDLELLLSGKAPTPSAASPASMRAAAPPPPARPAAAPASASGGEDDLDMTK